MTSDILPCGYCNNKSSTLNNDPSDENHNIREYYLQCDNYGCNWRTPIKLSEEEAINFWNIIYKINLGQELIAYWKKDKE